MTESNKKLNTAVQSIEVIDLRKDGGGSTVTLDQIVVMALSDDSNKNTITIKGDNKDIVTLKTNGNGMAGNWQTSETSNTYQFKTSSPAVLVATVVVEGGVVVTISH